MTNPINQMPEALDAYQASLDAMDRAHDVQKQLLAAQPMDWPAYDAAQAATTDCQAAAQAAMEVYQATILDSPALKALLDALKAETALIKAETARLAATAKTLDRLAQAADALTSTLKVIAKFV